MTRVIRGNNEVMTLPKMKILMTPTPGYNALQGRLATQTIGDSDGWRPGTVTTSSRRETSCLQNIQALPTCTRARSGTRFGASTP
jgi:hypothetical protein